MQEELSPDTGPTFTDITQEIEYQRANVVAKTKITDEVFQCATPCRTWQLFCFQGVTPHNSRHAASMRC